MNLVRLLSLLLAGALLSVVSACPSSDPDDDDSGATPAPDDDDGAPDDDDGAPDDDDVAPDDDDGAPDDDDVAPDDDDSGTPPDDDDTDVTVYGAAGTFGTLVDVTPTGQTLEVVPVPGWVMDGGLMPFFTAVTSDGTVFVANMQQTLNQFFRASCTMAITCFNPDSAACYDADTGGAANVSTIRIPTLAGDFYNPPDGETTCASLTRGLGSDVSDIEVVIDADGIERVAFVSFIGSIVVGLDGFPAFGSLVLTADGWALDAASVRFPEDLQGASDEGLLGCPNAAKACFFQTDCPGGACISGRCDIECASGSDCPVGQTCLDEACGVPNCALNEQVVLPASGHLATAHYTAARISVMDAAGTFQAVYVLPTVTDPCHLEANLTLSPREVAADPTSSSGDERFVVVYDSGFEKGYPVQEFTYDAAAHTLVPTSAPFVPWAPVDGPTVCGSAPRRGSHPTYDDRGNLWIDTNHGLGRGALYVFQTNSDTGLRSYEATCFLDPETGSMYEPGHACRSDLDLGVATLDGQTPTGWGYPWGSSLLYDPTSESVIFGGVGASIGFIQGTDDADVFYATETISLGAPDLPPPVADEEVRFSAKGILDLEERVLWKPHGTTAVTGPVGCNFFTCTWAMFDPKDFWMFRLAVDPVRSDAVEVLAVTDPDSVAVGAPFNLELVLDLPGGLADLDPTASVLALYLDDATTPAALVDWQEGTCTADGCGFQGFVLEGVTDAGVDTLYWHALFTTSEDPARTLHATGRIAIIP
jgi:hypothetical protein